jgi:hypothetical protein
LEEKDKLLAVLQLETSPTRFLGWSGVRAEDLDAVVVAVRDIDVSAGVDRDTEWIVKLSWPRSERDPGFVPATSRRELLDLVAQPVGNTYVAVFIERDPNGGRAAPRSGRGIQAGAGSVARVGWWVSL